MGKWGPRGCVSLTVSVNTDCVCRLSGGYLIVYTHSRCLSILAGCVDYQVATW